MALLPLTTLHILEWNHKVRIFLFLCDQNSSDVFTLDYVVRVAPDSISISEDGSIGDDIHFSASGFSFGSVIINMTRLTYTQYQALTGHTVEQVFQNPPPPASGDGHF